MAEYNKDTRVYAPRLVQGMAGENVCDLQCGRCHVVALDQQGKVFVWGNNEHGQLGLGHTEQTQPVCLSKSLEVEELEDPDMALAPMTDSYHTMLYKRAFMCPLRCSQAMAQGKLAAHLLGDCAHRIVPCCHRAQGCGWSGRQVDEAPHHRESCDEAEVACPLGCDVTPQRKVLRAHLQDACGCRIVQCTVGCGLSLQDGQRRHHEIFMCPKRNVMQKLAGERAFRDGNQLEGLEPGPDYRSPTF